MCTHTITVLVTGFVLAQPVFYLIRLKRKAVLPNLPFRMSHQTPLEKL